MVMMNEPIARKVYYSIGEVCDLTGLKPHVLRYWETQFEVLNPTKNRAGNRVYRSKDIELVLLVKHLLYEKKYTIEGANKRLAEMRSRASSRRSARTC
jgi:DNA-binding transcriptional MerR regulator